MTREIMRFYLAVIAISMMLVSGCEPKGQAINYGGDSCDFCRMSIVDKRFGCEVVTTKGKVFKFDAVECMINHLDQNVEDESTIKLILTNTFDTPNQLLDAPTCTYLISKKMPSPMGAYLNPFQSAEEAQKKQAENDGELYSWKELRAKFASK